jgi:hypothetical protein
MDALTGRRLGGALFVLCGLAVAAIVLWPSGGDDAAPARPARIQPVRIVSVPQLGLTFAHPSTWRRSVAGGVIRLRSPERGTLLTFASPTPGSHTQRLKADIKRVLRGRFSPATIVREGPGRLGARPATTFELEGFGPQGRVRALVVVASSRHRTYAVTLLTPIQPSARRLAQVQQILATVRLVKPRPGPPG